MKQVIGKAKSINNSFPKRMIIDSIEFFDQNKIANSSNKRATNIAAKMASSIPNTSELFQKFVTVSEKVF